MSNCLPFGRMDVLRYQRCNIPPDGFLCRCMAVPAAVAHCSGQSKKKLCAHEVCCLPEKCGGKGRVTEEERTR